MTADEAKAVLELAGASDSPSVSVGDVAELLRVDPATVAGLLERVRGTPPAGRERVVTLPLDAVFLWAPLILGASCGLTIYLINASTHVFTPELSGAMNGLFNWGCLALMVAFGGWVHRSGIVARVRGRRPPPVA